MAKAAPKTATKEVAPVEEKSQNVANSMPSFMDQYAGAGTENVGSQDIETPRIKLLQGLSPELEQFDTAKVGRFWHSIANMDLGNQVRIVPIYVEIMAILWNPRESGGGILARSTDLQTWVPDHGEAKVKINKGTKEVTWKWDKSVAASGLMEWGSADPSDNNSQPAATKMYNIVVAMPDFPDLPPGVITLQRKGVRPAKKLMSQLKLTRVPSFGCVFNMSSVTDKNGVGQEFKNYAFNSLGMVQDEAEFTLYRKYYESFKAMGLQIKDIDGLADEPAETGDTADNSGVAY